MLLQAGRPPSVSRARSLSLSLSLTIAIAALPLRRASAEEPATASTSGCPRGARCAASPSTPVAESHLLPEWGVRSKGRLRFQWTISSFDIDDGHFIAATGFGVSVTPWAPQRPNGLGFLNLATMVYLGDFGDDRHGPVTWQLAYRPELSIPTGSSVVELYAGPRVAYNLSLTRPTNKAGHSASFGTAVGIDLLGGVLGFELGSSAVRAIDDDFRPLGRTRGSLWKARADLTLSTNLCFFLGDGGRGGNFCAYPAPSPVQVDLSEPLEVGMIAALRPGGAADAGLCRAVDAAASVHAMQGDCDDDSAADRFFRRLVARSEGKPFEEGARRASALHAALSACYAAYGDEVQAAKLANRSLSRAEQYLVDPSEMRRVLSCEPAVDGVAASPFVADPVQLERACEACPEACKLFQSSSRASD